MIAGPTLIHGFAGSSDEWGEAVLEGLNERGFSPAAIDLPGHGQRRGEAGDRAYTIDAVASLVGAVQEEVGSVVGYSMGGRLALHYAHRYQGRVSRLVLESASPGLQTEEERSARRSADSALAERISLGGVEAFVEEWEKLPLFASQRLLAEEKRASVRAGRLRNDARSLAAALAGLGTGALPSLWGQLSEIRAPTLLIVGEEDEKFVRIAERMAGQMPSAEVQIVEGAGHNVHLERPGDWCDAVAAFLKAP